MTPLITIAAVFVSLSVASGRIFAQANAVAGQAEQGLRGGRKLHKQVMYCSSLQCPDRSTPIAAASAVECEGDTCRVSQCCEAKCSYYQCPTWAVPMEEADGIVCPGLECTNVLCCEHASGIDEWATAIASGTGFLPSSARISSSATFTTGGGRRLQEKPLFCSSIQCPDRATPIVEAGTTECGDMCNAFQCCQAKCSHHQCPGLSTPVDAADETVCADLECSDGMCCEALCSYYQCPAGTTLVEGADDAVCPNLECSAGLCCE